MVYWIVPFAAWFLTGIIKFIINTLKYKEMAWKYVGYGGMPSNHSAIVSSIFFYVGFKEGFNTPMAGVAATVMFVVVMDALSLRKNIGKHAGLLNKLSFGKLGNEEKPLRESMGHKPIEVAVGLLLGLFYAWGFYFLFK